MPPPRALPRTKIHHRLTNDLSRAEHWCSWEPLKIIRNVPFQYVAACLYGDFATHS